MIRRSIAVTSASLLAVAGLTACSQASDAATETVSAAASQTSSASASASSCPLEVSEAWALATKGPNSAAFGKVTNTSAEDVTITGASSPAATTVTLSEMVDDGGTMTMQDVEGGFVVPAGDHLHLEDSGYHLMLMEIPEPIVEGAEIAVTLTCATGATAEFTAMATTAPADGSVHTGDDMDMGESSE